MLIQKLVYVSQVGATAVLYVLIVLSVISVGVIFHRWSYFRRRKFDLAATSASLQKHLRGGEINEAREMLRKSPAIEAAVLHDALGIYDDGPDALAEILQNGIRQRRKSFEGGLLFLGTLGNNAPFIGLFGTVLGVVAAFRELGAAAGSAATGGGMGNVMSGIAEALVATGIGILVALPAVVAYNIYQKRGSDVEENTYALGNVVLAAMKARSARPRSVHSRHATVEEEASPDDVGSLSAEAEA